VSFLERAFNWLLGLSVLSWAVLGLVNADPPARLTLVRIGISLINLTVGSLLIIRAPVVSHGSVGAIAASLPGLVVAGFALQSAPAPHLWNLPAQGLFAAGGLIALVSFVSLGRSFALLPAVRRVVGRGPYRLVRHPAYLGELALVASCFVAGPSWATAAPALAAAPLVVVRILAEERVLLSADEYRSYSSRVRWRLFPWLW